MQTFAAHPTSQAPRPQKPPLQAPNPQKPETQDLRALPGPLTVRGVGLVLRFLGLEVFRVSQFTFFAAASNKNPGVGETRGRRQLAITRKTLRFFWRLRACKGFILAIE